MDRFGASVGPRPEGLRRPPTRTSVGRRLGRMSAARDELMGLVQQIPEEQVPYALAEVRRHLLPAHHRDWPPAQFAIAEGDGTDVGAHSEEILREGFGR